MGALSLWPADGLGTKSLAAQQDIAALFSGLDVHQNHSLILFFFFFFVYLAFMLKMRFIGLGKKFKLLNVNYIITKTQSCLYLKYLFDLLP